jgi:hypothetical protein
MDAEINNVIYMELYSGPKMAHDKYEKTNVAGSIDRDSTVLGALSQEVELPRHEADNSPPSSTVAKNAFMACTGTPSPHSTIVRGFTFVNENI